MDAHSHTSYVYVDGYFPVVFFIRHFRSSVSLSTQGRSRSCTLPRYVILYRETNFSLPWYAFLEGNLIRQSTTKSCRSAQSHSGKGMGWWP